MKNTLKILAILFTVSASSMAQVVITNSNFSLGTTGRIGIEMSPNREGNQWKPLNLSGQGSLAGHMEQNNYARDNHYSPYLQINQKSWGTYIGIKTEWWLF